MHVLCTRQAGCDRWAGVAAAGARRAGPVCVWCSSCCLFCSVQRLSWGLARHDRYNAHPPPLSRPCVNLLSKQAHVTKTEAGCWPLVPVGRQATLHALGDRVSENRWVLAFQAAWNRLNLAGNRWKNPFPGNRWELAGNTVGNCCGGNRWELGGNCANWRRRALEPLGNPGPYIWELLGNP